MAIGTYICFGQILENHTVIGISIISLSMLAIFYQQYTGSISAKTLEKIRFQD
jgi:hypothetical protein